MAPPGIRCRLRRVFLATTLAVGVVSAGGVEAQVTTAIEAGGLGTAVTPPPGGTGVFTISGGTPKGPNLFHSFSAFSVGQTDGALFNRSNGIVNILGRVTGVTPSSIDGGLGSNPAGANLFLINPNGVILGPNASLNIGGAFQLGSFHASTADYVAFGGKKFYANPGSDGAADSALVPNGLAVANPTAFGFLPTPEKPVASISVEGSNLQVSSGQQLSIVGGDIQIIGGLLTAPGGRIQVASMKSIGEVPIPDLAVSTSAQLGTVVVSGGSRLDASGDPLGTGAGGTVIIRAGEIRIDGFSLFGDGKAIAADTFGSVDGALVGIDLKATNQLFLSGTSVGTQAFGSGRGGDVRLAADGNVTIDASQVSSTVMGDGVGGDIAVSGLTLAVTNFASITSSNQSFGPGVGGSITLTATGAMSIDQSVVVSSTLSGDGGHITVSGPSSLTLSNGSAIASSTSDVGRGGNIDIDGVGQLSLTGSSTIQSTTGFGAGGRVMLNVTGSGVISGGEFSPSGILSSSFGTARAGVIIAHFGTLSLTDGALIQSGTAAGTQGGNVTVTATESILIAGRNAIDQSSGIASQASVQDVGTVTVSTPKKLTLDDGYISTSTLGDGRAGDISVQANELILRRGGQITSDSFNAPGSGGNITVTVTATGSVLISGRAPGDFPSSPLSTDLSSGIFSTTSSKEPTAGAAGSITMMTPTLALADGGKLSVETTGAGNAGRLVLDVSGALSVGSSATVASSTSGSGQGGLLAVNAGSISLTGLGSGLLSTTSSQEPTAGAAGSIVVTTPTLTLADGGKLSVETTGAGNAGRLVLDVSGALSVGSSATVASSTSNSGQGGSLAVNAGSISLTGLGSGLLSTTSSEEPTAGRAGSITVTTPTLLMNDNSKISVATTGPGNAGTVSLNVGEQTISNGARVDSSTSGAGLGGTVALKASGLTMTGTGSGLFSNAQGSGSGGDINVTANQGQLLDGATISAKSTGTASAFAGNVNIVMNDLTMKGNSSITTASDLADGGNISITTTGSRLYLLDSQLTTSVGRGQGSGGNITVGSQAHPFDSVILNGGEIRADAFGGPGGNIRIFADTFLIDRSVLSASSALSTPGTINVQARFTNLSGNIAQLPETVVQAAELLRAACAARLSAGKTSSLVVAGREGVPLEPGGVMPSPLIAESLTDLGPSRSDRHEWEPLPGVWRVSLQSKCSM